MIRKSIVAGLGVAVGLACGRASLDPTPDPRPKSSETGEAALILQSTTHEDFVTDSAIRLVVRALRIIRAQYSEVRKINNGIVPELELQIDSSMVKGLCTARSRDQLPKPVLDSVEKLGLPAVDSLNHRLGATKVHIRVCFGKRIYVNPIFHQFPNVRKLAERYKTLPGIIDAGEVMYLGGGDGVGMTPEGKSLRFVFVRRWGDCPSGCINRRTYEFRYWPRSGRVQKLREEGDALPPEAA